MDERRRFRLIPRGLSESRSIRLSVKGNYGSGQLWFMVNGSWLMINGEGLSLVKG